MVTETKGGRKAGSTVLTPGMLAWAQENGYHKLVDDIKALQQNYKSTNNTTLLYYRTLSVDKLLKRRSQHLTSIEAINTVLKERA